MSPFLGLPLRGRLPLVALAVPHRHRGSAAPAPRRYLPVAELRPRSFADRLPHALRGLAISRASSRPKPRSPAAGPAYSHPRVAPSWSEYLQALDLDPERRDFHRQRVAKTADSPLGRVIRRVAGNPEATADRRHLKDVTALLLAHHRSGGTGGVHHPAKARVHDGLEILRTHLLERCNLPVTSIVDEHVQTPEALHRQLHGCLCGGLIAHFQPGGLHPLAVLRHQGRQLFRPTRSGYHAVPCGQRRLDDVPPQPTSASRNQPNLRHENPPFLLLA